MLRGPIRIFSPRDIASRTSLSLTNGATGRAGLSARGGASGRTATGAAAGAPAAAAKTRPAICAAICEAAEGVDAVAEQEGTGCTGGVLAARAAEAADAEAARDSAPPLMRSAAGTVRCSTGRDFPGDALYVDQVLGSDVVGSDVAAGGAATQSHRREEIRRVADRTVHGRRVHAHAEGRQALPEAPHGRFVMRVDRAGVAHPAEFEQLAAQGQCPRPDRRRNRTPESAKVSRRKAGTRDPPARAADGP